MRAFVTGTGRCGTKTWARACSHITNYTSGHESYTGPALGYLSYPDQHIEVDPHLSWMLALLTERYPDALFVHLWRPEDEVVASWKRRGIHPHRGAAPLIDVIYQTRCRDLTAKEYDLALRSLYRSVFARCEWFVSHRWRGLSVSIYDAPRVWPMFCEILGAQGDLAAGFRDIGRRAA